MCIRDRIYDLLKQFIRSEERDFRIVMDLFKRDDTFADYYDIIQPYVDAFKIIEITPVENSKSKFYALEAPLRDGNKININSRYVHTELDLERKKYRRYED